MNLLEETIEFLAEYGYTPGDVEWVGSRDGSYAISWNEFAEIANIEYDAGYGGQEIATDLVAVGESFWLERSEYDGSESWSLKSKPARAAAAAPFVKVGIGLWDTIAALQEERPAEEGV